MQPERPAGERDVHPDLVLARSRRPPRPPSGRRRAPRCRPRPRGCRRRPSGTRRCSAPSGRARGRAARRTRRRRAPRWRARSSTSPSSPGDHGLLAGLDAAAGARPAARPSCAARRCVSSQSTRSARRPRWASSNVSPTTAMPSSIGITAVTPGSASAALSSTEAAVAPNLGGCSTTAVSIPGRVTSIVNRVCPRIFPGESTRSRPSRPDQPDTRPGSFGWTSSGTGSCSARAASSPKPARFPLGWRHHARLELDFSGGHAPRLGRGRGQPRPRLGGGQPVARPEPLVRVGRAGQLDEPAARRGCRTHRPSGRPRWPR